MSELKTYQNYYDIIFTGYGNISYNNYGDIIYKKKPCSNCIKVNDNIIFWNLFLLKNIETKKNYIKPIFIIKRNEIVNYINIFNSKTFFKITLPNVNGNDMIITNKLDDFIKFVKYTGDSIFLVEKYFPQQLLFDYKKIKYRYIVFLYNEDILIYPIHLVLVSNLKSKIKNEKKLSYTLMTDNDYKFIFNKDFSIKTFGKVKKIINDIKTTLYDITNVNKNNYSIFSIDFIYDVDQNIYLDNIQSINDINYDKGVKNNNTVSSNAYYGYLGKNIHNFLLNKKTILVNLKQNIEGFKNTSNISYYIIFIILILWVVKVLKLY